MENNTKSQTYSIIIRQATEIGITTLISAYFFTTGYINSFSLPIKTDVFQSGYFLITLFADSIPSFLFNIITEAWKLPLHLLTFFRNSLNLTIVTWKFVIENKIVVVIVTILLVSLSMVFVKLKTLDFLKKKTSLIMSLQIQKKLKFMHPPFRFPFYYILFIMIVKLILDQKNVGLFTTTFGNIQKELQTCVTFAGPESKFSCADATIFLYDVEFYINSSVDIVFILAILFITFSIPIFIRLNSKNIRNFGLASKGSIFINFSKFIIHFFIVLFRTDIFRPIY